MRKLLTTFVCVWFTLAVWAGDGIYEKLQQIPQIFLLFSLNITFLYIFYFLSIINSGSSSRSIIPIPRKGLSGNGCCWGINNRMRR